MSRDRKSSGRKRSKAAKPAAAGLRSRFASVALIAFAAAYLYVFLEWLFFLTKPSFLSASGLASATVVLGLAALGLALPAVLAVGVIFAGASVASSGSVGAVRLSLAVPALILATLWLLLIDNFTYTIWEFGIVSSQGGWVWVYTGVYLALLLSTFRWLVKVETTISSRAARRLSIGAGALALVSLLCLGFVDRQTLGWSRYISEAGVDPETLDKPNILIFTSDGLSATHMSAYGYRRETTPFIESFVREKPVRFFENAFSNAANTGGSLTSLLTGKYPFTVRVVQAPQILRGKDSLQHFPAILKNLGYRSIYYGMRDFADPFDANMLDSFDQANDRTAPRSALLDAISAVAGQNTTFFARTLFHRAADRILHLLHIQPMEDVFATVTKGLHLAPRYKNLYERVIEFIDESDRPFFAFIHNMGTHGPKYYDFGPERKYSQWSDPESRYDPDFYDDAIRGYDYGVQQVVEHLEKTGKLRNTIIVLGSDHGFRWDQLQRVPLILFFPDGRHRGTTRVNVQNLDIAPTLLEYLGLPKPQWMEGRSLLDPENIDEIPIIGTRVWDKFDFDGEDQYERAPVTGRIPPLYLFRRISVIYCATALDFHIQEDEVERSQIPGHTGGCEATTVPSDVELKAYLRGEFLRTGFDVSWLDASAAGAGGD